MRKKYSEPFHIKSYIEKELYNYIDNKVLLNELKEDIYYTNQVNDGQPKGNGISNPTEQKATDLLTTRSILIAEKKVKQIDNAFNRLIPEERKIAEMIFFKGYNQVFMQMNKGVGKDTYYHIKNKTIYYTAIEYGEI